MPDEELTKVKIQSAVMQVGNAWGYKTGGSYGVHFSDGSILIAGFGASEKLAEQLADWLHSQAETQAKTQIEDTSE